MQSLADRVKRVRKLANLTQDELVAITGWKKSRISNYETGYRKPKTDDLVYLGECLESRIGKTGVYFLITGKEITSLLEESKSQAPFIQTQEIMDIIENQLDKAKEFGIVTESRENGFDDFLATIFKKLCDRQQPYDEAQAG